MTFRRITAFLLGASLVLSYAPFAQAWLVIPVLIAMLALTESATPAVAWRCGFYFGLGWFTTGLSWIYVSIDQFGGLPVVASLVILLLLFAYLALYPALAFWLWRMSARWLGACAIGILPIAWLIAESLRGSLLTGFPWLELGYSQTDSWLGAYAPWLGGVGVTVILWLIAINAWLWYRHRYHLAALSTCSLLILPFILNALSPIQTTGDTTKVLLVQGNIEQSIKWNPDQHWQSLTTYLELSRPYYASHDIIVWPESAVTMPEPYTDDVLKNIHQQLVESRAALITGIIDYRGNKYYNSLITLGLDSPVQPVEPYYHGHSNRYQKHQLLPIGEFVPFESLLRPLAPLFDLPMSSFSRGEYQQADLRATGLHLSAAICYEIAFAEQMRTNTTANSELLITVSNDTWFGRSHGPAQHMQIARMRALELGRPLLRATNNGITAVVSAHGEELARAPQFTTTVLSADVPLVQGYTGFYYWGHAGAWLIAIILALGSILGALLPHFYRASP